MFRVAKEGVLFWDGLDGGKKLPPSQMFFFSFWGFWEGVGYFWFHLFFFDIWSIYYNRWAQAAWQGVGFV